MAYIVGISAHFHDAACCLLKDGVLIAAAEEERFTRRKHDATIPIRALKYCLEEARLSLAEIEAIAYYEQPKAKFSRQLCMLAQSSLIDANALMRVDPRRPEREMRDVLGYEGKTLYFSHHESHAASAYYYSGFNEAAILTTDSVGEWQTTSYGSAANDNIQLFDSVDFPNSLGLLYSAITDYLGFEVNEGEYKVMGLAPYGKPLYRDNVYRLISNLADGRFELDLKYFDFLSTKRMYTEKLVELFGQPGREAESPVSEFHINLARSVQLVLEEILLSKAFYLAKRTGLKKLCMAGGVALNCVATSRIRRDGPFDEVFVQPVAGDGGGCLGAAALAHRKLGGASARVVGLEHLYLGPEYSPREIRAFIEATGIPKTDYENREDALIEHVAAVLDEGKIVGWFNGRMEFGPRALGARSILADPRRANMKDKVNALVKNRESFRPFAPSVLEAYAGLHFALDHPARFMTEIASVISPLSLPAITHVDGSARVQTVDEATNPRFAKLLKGFYRKTGCPILLNTSFNVRGEPIVCAPSDALVTFMKTDIDVLVLGDFLLEQADLTGSAVALLYNRNIISAPDAGYKTYTFF